MPPLSGVFEPFGDQHVTWQLAAGQSQWSAFGARELDIGRDTRGRGEPVDEASHLVHVATRGCHNGCSSTGAWRLVTDLFGGNMEGEAMGAMRGTLVRDSGRRCQLWAALSGGSMTTGQALESRLGGGSRDTRVAPRLLLAALAPLLSISGPSLLLRSLVGRARHSRGAGLLEGTTCRLVAGIQRDPDQPVRPAGRWRARQASAPRAGAVPTCEGAAATSNPPRRRMACSGGSARVRGHQPARYVLSPSAYFCALGVDGETNGCGRECKCYVFGFLFVASSGGDACLGWGHSQPAWDGRAGHRPSTADLKHLDVISGSGVAPHGPGSALGSWGGEEEVCTFLAWCWRVLYHSVQEAVVRGVTVDGAYESTACTLRACAAVPSPPRRLGASYEDTRHGGSAAHQQWYPPNASCLGRYCSVLEVASPNRVARGDITARWRTVPSMHACLSQEACGRLEWLPDCRRIGEAKNPGPPRGDVHCQRHRGGTTFGQASSQDAGAVFAAWDNELVASIVAFQGAWSSWARCILLEAEPCEDVDVQACRAQGVSSSANLARSALLHLARRRAAWQRQRVNVDDADGAGASGSAASGARGRKATRSEDPLAIGADDPARVAAFKRGLREVADKVRKVFKGKETDTDVLSKLRDQVQHLAQEAMAPSPATLVAVEPPSAPIGVQSGSQDARRRGDGTYGASSGRAYEGRRRVTRGRNEESKPQYLDVMFGNVTSFSPKAKAHLLRSGASIWLAVESHLRGDRLSGEVERLAGGGWHCSYSEATPSDRSELGNQGGVLAASRGHLCVRPMADDVRELHGHRSFAEDLVGLNVPLRGSEVLVFGSYAREGHYLQQLSEVAKVTLQGRIPFVWLADFNAPADALEAEPGVAALDAVVVRPSGGRISCHQGAGSLIDFAIVSRRILPLIDLSLVPEVPWSPHDGLRLRIRKNTRQFKVKKLARPLGYDHEHLEAIAGEPWALPWETAKRMAAQELAHVDLTKEEVLKEQRGLMRDLGCLDESVELGKRVMAWARASELQALAARGIDLAAREAGRAKGRALPPRFYQAPILRRRCDPGPQRLPGGCTDDARLWATLHVMLGKLRKAMVSECRPRIATAKSNLIMAAASTDGSVWRAWLTVASAGHDNAARMAIFRACSSAALLADVEAAESLMERLGTEAKAAARRNANASWQMWVAESIKGGARRAHRWSNAPNAAPVDVVAPNCFEPSQVVQYHTDKWAEKWLGNDAVKVQQATKVVKELRERAVASRTHGRAAAKIDAGYVLQVANAFAKSTAIGVDAQAFYEVAESTEEARGELACIMRTAIHKVAWPVQSLLVLMGLLGKKAGGTRTIAIISSFGRLLLAAVKDEVRAWDEQVANPHDTALKGRRPADETARRHLRVEVATLLGKFSALVLWDMKAFFDSLDASRLVEAAEDADFPLDQLALGLILHRAPRMLRVQGCYGDSIARTGRSVLAGCTLSTSFARAYLRPLTLECKSDHTCTLGQHVDDLTQMVVAPTQQLAVARAVAKGRQLAEAARGLLLDVADKSRVVASTPTAAAAIAAGIRGAGVTILSAGVAEDLGVSTSAGRRRVVGSFARRIAKASRRAARVRTLVSTNVGAKKLFRTGVDPQQNYEAAILGAAPPQIRAMRRNAAMCVAKAGSHPCMATLLAWRIGYKNDPAVMEPLRQVQMWMRLWQSTPAEERATIRKAWRRALPKVLLKGVHWGRVSGLLQATIATLGQMGWAPVQPDRWLVADRLSYADLSDEAPEAPNQILQAVEGAAAEEVWKGASQHWLGKGLEEGIPSLEPARAARKWLVRQHQATEVKALDTVLCGGAWCGGRSQLKRRCRCGAEENPWHRYWGCGLLEEICDQGGRPVVKETQWLASVLGEHYAQYECLWGRAIVPHSLSYPGPPLSTEQAEATTTPGFTAALNTTGIAYSDGSGGPKHAPSSAPAAGSGVAVVRWDNGTTPPTVRSIDLAAAAVPGRQTVPRAELWAACVVAKHANEGSPCVLNSDAAYVVNTAADAAKTSRARRGANGDLWSQLARLHKGRGAPLHIAKVTAHSKPVDVLEGRVDVANFLGNHLADAAAGAAAERALHSNERAQLVERWHQRAYLIAKRLAAIESWHWQNSPSELCDPPPPLPPWAPPVLEDVRAEVSNRVTDNGHVLRKEGDKIICGRCHKKRGPKNHAYWLGTVCVPVSCGQISSCGAPRRPRQVGELRAATDEDGCGRINACAGGDEALGGCAGSLGGGDGGEEVGGGSKRRRRDTGGEGDGQSGPVDAGGGCYLSETQRLGHSVGGGFPELDPTHDHITSPQRGDDAPGAPQADELMHSEGQAGDANYEDGMGTRASAASSTSEVGQINGHGGINCNDIIEGTSIGSGYSAGGGYSLNLPGHDLGSYDPTMVYGTEGHFGDLDLPSGGQWGSSGGEGGPSAAACSSDLRGVGSGAKRIRTGSRVADEDVGAEAPAPPAPQAQSFEDILMVQAANAEQGDDPFGFNQLGFDEGQAPASAAAGGTPRGGENDGGAQPPEPLISARERRKLILSRAAERNKRKRAEAEAVARAWSGGDAAVSVDGYLQLPPAQSAPPFPVHASHSLVICGGFTGCVRCGRVVAFQGHGRFGEACRGSCPTGSQRPIRRLIKGMFPHDVHQRHLAPPWPDGLLNPTPQRWRPQ